MKKDESPFTRHHAAEALNFHLTFAIAAIVSAIAAGRREPYRYPLTIRFVR